MFFSMQKITHIIKVKLTTLLGIFFILFGGQANTLKADHVMGADMSYRCLGNDKYKITVKFYRDCRGEFTLLVCR